jgi:hypothetical protein
MAEAPLERKESGKDLRQLVLQKREMKLFKWSSIISKFKNRTGNCLWHTV